MGNLKITTIDFETRSTVDLIKAGSYAYAEDPTTDILILSVKEGDNPPWLWVAEKFKHLIQPAYGSSDLYWGDVVIKTDRDLEVVLETTDMFEAHNAQFERNLWREVMHKRYGFEDIPLEKWRCSAAKAAVMAIPRSLAGACDALQVPIRKDIDGRKIMLKMCRTHKAVKAQVKELEAEGCVVVDATKGHWKNSDGSDFYIWKEDPADFEILCRYCLQDTDAEHALSKALPDLTPSELEVWREDQIVNDRGINVDLASIDNIMAHIAEHSNKKTMELQEITEGQVSTAKQNAAMQTFLATKGLDMPNMQAETVATVLRDDMFMDDTARKVLEIRQSLNKSSTAKYLSMKVCACVDGRVRGAHLYHGAGTGRFAGKLIQPQNFPRGTLGEWSDEAINEFNTGTLDNVSLFYGDPLEAAASCLRGMICAAPGNKFLCADFASIEARVLAWLAGEQHVLDAFIEGLDLYKVAAEGVYGVSYDEVTKDQRQIGKVAELACGYQGGQHAFLSMAGTYGVYVEADKAKAIVRKWRDGRPNTVRFWHKIEDAAAQAIRSGKAVQYGRIKFGITSDDFLMCLLPSGRCISYYKPVLAMGKTPWGEPKEMITHMGTNAKTKKWEREKTYGGKLVENIVQAVARDLLTEAMLREEKAGYPVVMHVHDEILSEVAEGYGSLEEFCSIMSEVPAWAEGCPLAAGGWEGFRFRK